MAPEWLTFPGESLSLYTQLESYEDGPEKVDGKNIGGYTLGCDSSSNTKDITKFMRSFEAMYHLDVHSCQRPRI